MKIKPLKNLKIYIYYITASFAAVTLLHSAERPNILFAFADDWGRHASVYAEVDGEGTVNDAVNTPNFDAISKTGVLFNNALIQ